MNTKDNSISNWIEKEVMQIPGWSSSDELLTLYNYAVASSYLGGDIIEIGSWCGRSTVVFARAQKQSNGGCVHAIDLFPAKSDWSQNPDGSYSFTVDINNKKIDAYNVQTVWKEPFERDIAPIYEKYNGIYDAFNEMIGKSGFNSIVKPFLGTASMFMEQLSSGFKCRLAFIDGDHSYKSVCKDIDVVENFLLPGGWICFDDAFTTYEGVNKAIEERILSNNSYELSHQATRKLFVARRVSL